MLRSDIIRKVIELGKPQGSVTFDELNQLLPPNSTAPEDIETLFEVLHHEGISVTED